MNKVWRSTVNLEDLLHSFPCMFNLAKELQGKIFIEVTTKASSPFDQGVSLSRPTKLDPLVENTVVQPAWVSHLSSLRRLPASLESRDRASSSKREFEGLVHRFLSVTALKVQCRTLRTNTTSTNGELISLE